MVSVNNLKYFPNIIKNDEDEIVSEFKTFDELASINLDMLMHPETVDHLRILYEYNSVRTFLRLRPSLTDDNPDVLSFGIKMYDNPTVWGRCYEEIEKEVE